MMLRTELARLLAWFGFIEKPEFLVAASLDVPGSGELKAATVVVVGPKERPKWATFQCPSGCGTPLLLSLNPDRRPRWVVTFDWLGRPTLNPSVRRTDGCRCHFLMQKGRIVWCEDNGRTLPEN